VPRYALALTLLIPAALLAQAPVVIAVVNANGDARLAPAMIATVRGANLGASERTVTVGGLRASLFPPFFNGDEVDTRFDIRLPSTLPPGPASVVVTTGAGSSAPVSITIHQYSPDFIYPSFRRSSAADGPPEMFINDCFVGQNTAQPGEWLWSFAIGLESPDPGFEPGVMVGNLRAELVDYGVGADPSTWVVGFRVPPGDGIFPVTLLAPGETSRPLMLPIGSVRGWSFLGLHRGSPESLVSTQSCGPNLADIDASFRGDPAHPPGVLGGVTVKVKDAAGVERIAPLVQLNCCGLTFVVPAGTAPGLAVVTAVTSHGSIAGYLDVRAVSPVLPLVSGASNGRPDVSGYIVRLRQGVQSVEAAAALLRNGVYGFEIDMGPETDDVYLVLLGTGLRNRSSLAGVRAIIADVETPVAYVGPQSEAAGVDQVNVKLPRSLVRRGISALQIAFDGVPADPIFLDFK
jgi:uncharacterized protein (TIGR03437 family)